MPIEWKNADWSALGVRLMEWKLARSLAARTGDTRRVLTCTLSINALVRYQRAAT